MNSLDDIFNDASAIVSSNDDSEICASYVALLYVGRKSSELSFKKSSEELIHEYVLKAKRIRRFLEAYPYIRVTTETKMSNWLENKCIYDEFDAKVLLYPYTVFSFGFESSLKTLRECQHLAYYLNQYSEHCIYIDLFKYAPKKKFFRFDIATGQFMPVLWGPEYQALTGKRIRRMFRDEALAMSKNMFEFFCSNQ